MKDKQTRRRNQNMALIWRLLVALTVISVIGTASAQQNDGLIVGRIVDQSNNEPLVGASVSVVGINFGAVSDLDGNYRIKNLSPRKYSLRFSYISYKTITVDEVMAEAGKETKINIALPPATVSLNEVVVTAQMLKTSEHSVLNIQKNAANIVDGVSAELIGKSNSSEGTDVLRKMTGVTISDGKYAYIRGVGDRYNNTLLNGSSLPSTDPEKKSFSYDLVPANLIENMLTSKSATPDKPADFSGGLIEIKTIEFPANFIFSFSSSSAYNSQTTFKNYMTYNGGGSDWLGTDDGTRAMPSLIGSQKVGKGNYTADELKQIGLQFKNNWQTKNTTAPLKENFKISLGSSYPLGERNTLGFIASLNHANNDETTAIQQSYFTFEGPKYQYKGSNYANKVSWSGMLNMSMKFGSDHKLSLKNMYNRNADNEVTVYEGPYYYNPDYRKITAFRYTSRSLTSSQLIGEHHFNVFKGVGLNWNMNHSNSKRDEPDARRYVYAKDLLEPSADFRFLLDQSISTRFFGELDDTNRGASFDVSAKLFTNPALPTLKFGFFYDKKDRQFDARIFGFRNLPGGNFMAEENLMLESVDKIFAPENFGNNFIEVIEITKPADSYTSDQNVSAAYTMTGFELFSKLKIITGLRFEKSQQNLNSFSITNAPVTIQSTYNDWLPSLNLTYVLSDKINLRAAYAKTLARPEFRELAPYTYFDFITNELVQGNVNLKRSRITNYDLRFEFYPSSLDLLALSGFYKEFADPIEQVLIASSGFEPIRSYENAKKGINYGLEIELKKKLGFIAPILNSFAAVGNVSLIHSEITLKNDNGFQVAKRPLQGQADYIYNLGLYYTDPNGIFSGSVIYNRVGETIHRVGFANLGDIIELPRDQVDMSVSAKFSKQVTFKFSTKDLLNQDEKFVQRTLEGDKTSELRRTGWTFSAGLTYNM